MHKKNVKWGYTNMYLYIELVTLMDYNLSPIDGGSIINTVKIESFPQIPCLAQLDIESGYFQKLCRLCSYYPYFPLLIA